MTHAPLPPAQGVLDRFSQIQPKLIFSVEAVVYNGKEHGHMGKLQQVVRGAWWLPGGCACVRVRTRVCGGESSHRSPGHAVCVKRDPCQRLSRHLVFSPLLQDFQT